MPSKRNIREVLPLSLLDCPKGFVPIVQEGALNFIQRKSYAELVARGALDVLDAQSVH